MARKGYDRWNLLTLQYLVAPYGVLLAIYKDVTWRLSATFKLRNFVPTGRNGNENVHFRCIFRQCIHRRWSRLQAQFRRSRRLLRCCFVSLRKQVCRWYSLVHLDFGGQNSGLLVERITKDEGIPIMTKMRHAARVIVLIVIKSCRHRGLWHQAAILWFYL